MKAATWTGVNEVSVEDVPEPTILNDHDIILEVGLTATCGSDLHLMGGYIPAMRAGDVLGHEFMGTVAEVGPGVTKHQVGDRVVVVSFTPRQVTAFTAHLPWAPRGSTPPAARRRGSPSACRAGRDRPRAPPPPRAAAWPASASSAGRPAGRCRPAG